MGETSIQNKKYDGQLRKPFVFKKNQNKMDYFSMASLLVDACLSSVFRAKP